MSSEKTNWKTYLQTGATATLAVILTHKASDLTNASCADKWATLGVAGAVGSMVGAYQAKGGSFTELAKRLKKVALGQEPEKEKVVEKVKTKSSK